jgi:hypothetical protein
LVWVTFAPGLVALWLLALRMPSTNFVVWNGLVRLGEVW